jgi:hypothetical protein
VGFHKVVSVATVIVTTKKINKESSINKLYLLNKMGLIIDSKG